MNNKAQGQLNDILSNGYNPYKKQLDESKKLVGKWQPTGLLEGLDKEYESHGMAVLLENQARQVIDEASRTGTSQNSEEWSGVALPLVRRIFGEIAAKDFVSVQPMNLPSGLVFYLNFKYGGGAGSQKHDFSANIHGVTDTKDVDASGGLYGAGRYGYSHSTGSQTLTAANSGSNWGNTNAIEGSKAINFDSTGSTVLYQYDVIGLDNDVDTDAIRSLEVVGASVVNEYTTYNNGTASFFATSALPGTTAGDAVTSVIEFVKANPNDYTRGDFEAAGLDANPETDLAIPEIDVAMESKTIIAKTRKLKAVWTPELAQDLNAYHSVDAEAELTSMLSEYISMEIDLEILDMLIANASTTEYWSAKIGYEYDSNNSSFTAPTAALQSGYAYTKNEWFQTLGNKIQRVSNKIHQKTMRGGANFLVCGPDVATVIESMPGWNAATDGNQSQFAMGVQQVGTLNNRFQVYKNPYMQENVVLCGFRGSNFLETGAVYAPYIPLIMTPLVYDPKNFTPRKGVMTRYAKKIVRPEFYGKIVVANPEAI